MKTNNAEANTKRRQSNTLAITIDGGEVNLENDASDSANAESRETESSRSKDGGLDSTGSVSESGLITDDIVQDAQRVCQLMVH